MAKSVKVFVETGIEKVFQYGESMLVQNLLNIVAKLLEIRATEYLALYLDHEDARFRQYLSPYRAVAGVQEHCAKAAAGQWRYRLRVRYVPARPSELLMKDRRLFEYFYVQTVLDVAQGQFEGIKEADALQLAALAIHVFFLSSGKKKMKLEDIEKMTNLERVFPPSMIDRRDPSSTFKLCEKACKQFKKDLKDLTLETARMKYFEVLLQACPQGYGRWTFEAVRHVSGGDDVPVSIFVDTAKITCTDPKDASRTVDVARFQELVRAIVVPAEAGKGLVIPVAKDRECPRFIFASDRQAEEFASLIDGHYHVQVNPKAPPIIEVAEGYTYPEIVEPREGSASAPLPADLLRPKEAQAAGGPASARLSLSAPSAAATLPTSALDASNAALRAEVEERRRQVQDLARTRSGSALPTIGGYALDPPPPPGPVAEGKSLDYAAEIRTKVTASMVELPRSELTLMGFLGEGQFGTVSQGRWSHGGVHRDVAVKSLKEGSSHDDRTKFIAEAAICSSFQHEHIVKCFGVCTAGEPALIVTELAPLGSLRQYLLDKRDSLTTFVLCHYGWQIASAMSYLEDRNLVHRDVAARNVLVAQPNKVKLTDFGLSRALDVDDAYYKASGGRLPIKWLAPECINYRRFTVKSDVWSFGVCAWEIAAYGEKPWRECKNRDYIEVIEQGARMRRPDGCPQALYQAMLACWSMAPEARPTFRDLYERLRAIVDEVGRAEARPGGARHTSVDLSALSTSPDALQSMLKDSLAGSPEPADEGSSSKDELIQKYLARAARVVDSDSSALPARAEQLALMHPVAGTILQHVVRLKNATRRQGDEATTVADYVDIVRELGTSVAGLLDRVARIAEVSSPDDGDRVHRQAQQTARDMMAVLDAVARVRTAWRAGAASAVHDAALAMMQAAMQLAVAVKALHDLVLALA